MKKLIFTLSLLLMAVAATAQTPAKTETKTQVANCSVDASGNYVALTRVQAQPTPTTKVFTDSKGVAHKVWISPKGREFYTRISKTTQKEYAVYLIPNTPKGGKPLLN